MGFLLKGHLLGAQNPVTTDLIIGNSVVITEGDAVTVSGGFAALATAGSSVLGIVAAITDANGIDLDSTVPANYDGTWSSSTKTYTATSDNQTDKMVKVKVIADPFALFWNNTAGTLAVTDEKLFFDLQDEDNIADQAGHATAGAFQLWKRDADTSTAGYFRIAEWQGNPYAQQ
jgi:hypothetical protein